MKTQKWTLLHIINQAAICFWIGLSGFLAITGPSMWSGVNLFLGFAIVIGGLEGLGWAILNWTAVGTVRRRTARSLVAIFVFVFGVFLVGVVEQVTFGHTGKVLPIFVTHDYGQTMPLGEIDHLRATDCRDLGPLEIVQSEHGYALRCGRFFWNAHTYVAEHIQDIQGMEQSK